MSNVPKKGERVSLTAPIYIDTVIDMAGGYARAPDAAGCAGDSGNLPQKGIE